MLPRLCPAAGVCMRNTVIRIYLQRYQVHYMLCEYTFEVFIPDRLSLYSTVFVTVRAR